MLNDILKHQSGRVISIGRTLLATVFFFAIWLDPTQPVQAAASAYALLVSYIVLAGALMVLTWNNWWRDAKLAAPAHLLDIAIFTMLVLATEGYTSPFFVFFVFVILSSAIRWSWRETTITALAVIFLYFAGGLLAQPAGDDAFELQRFIIRSGHLLTLSALLIWFGINQGFPGLKLPNEHFLLEPSPKRPAMEAAVEGAMNLTHARFGLLVWRTPVSSEAIATSIRSDGASMRLVSSSLVKPAQSQPFLFDLPRNRALSRGQERRIRYFAAANAVAAELAEEFDIREGLAIPIRTTAGEGLLLLGGIHGLSVDYVELGAFVGDAVAMHIQRHALLSAAEESAIARARLSLARDLHDSIVQFLAGATFRVEAVTRALRSGERPERELKHLKELLLLEQQELRSSIGALRKERVALPELASDLDRLCDRLARQWDINCVFSADVRERNAPMRFHLNTHQLIREAVANAVRHARAKSVHVHMTTEGSDLRLEISNDGSGSPRLKEGHPRSLRERVDEANGTLLLATHDNGTSLSITLPLGPEAQL